MQMYLFLAGKSFLTAQQFIIQNKELGGHAALHQVLAKKHFGKKTQMIKRKYEMAAPLQSKWG